MMLDSFWKIIRLIFIAQTLTSQNKSICANQLFRSSAEPVHIVFCQKDYYLLKQLKWLKWEVSRLGGIGNKNIDRWSSKEARIEK